MKHYALASFCLIVASWPSAATAHNVPINTGYGLLSHCTTEGLDQVENEYHLGQCLGFIKGVGNAWAIEHPKFVCITPGSDNLQLRNVVVEYLRMANRDRPAAYLVIEAMSEAFPCPKKQ